MKEYSTEKLRNIALISHSGVGKTSLAEAMVFTSGASNRLGKIEDGTTISDYHPDEIERKISITSSLMNVEWGESKINILDTPGYSDFIGEVIGSLRVVETSLVLLNAVSGIEVGTEHVWEAASEVNSSKIFFEDCVKYSKVIDKGKESGFYINALIYLGMINDVQKNRIAAIEYYNRVLDLDEYKKSHELAEKYLENPYKK